MQSKAIGSWVVWKGRLRRSSFIWRQALACVLFTAGCLLLERVGGEQASLVLYPPYFAVVLALAAQRLHDQARSAAWLLAVLVPVLGPLLLAWRLLVTRGTSGDNQYGPDPRHLGADYLRVDIHATR